MSDQANHETEPAVIPPETAIQSHSPGTYNTNLTVSPALSVPAVPIEAVHVPASVKSFDVLLVMLLLVLAFLIGSFAASNSDVWLHLASGRLIANGEWTIGVDPFSFATEATATHPAVPWIQQSWLYDLLFYLLYNLVGGAGLVVLKALGIGALAWCLLRIAGGRDTRFLAVIYVGLAVLAISPQIVLRPMTVSFLFFGITLLVCYKAGALGNSAPKPRILWLLPLVFLAWANMDAWFIMGPLTLALLWVGTGMGLALGIPRSFPGKTLGAVLVVGVLACVVNPHHVRVFMLPPELANLVLRVVDLPDFLGAGGRTLRNLNLVEDYYPLLSPLSAKHWSNPAAAGGQNVAGLAYYLLLLLGVIAFVVNAAVTAKPGARGLHPGRFILWAFLAFLSLLQVRLIPWFAIASAPITLLNLADWRAWLASTKAPNWQRARWGRAVAALVFLVLLFLARPGWLNGPLDNFLSPRRVAWDMPVDPSNHGAALRLAELNHGSKGLRVFNFSPDIAHYCAWYAPGVKCFLDVRWSLFPGEGSRAPKVRMALSANHPEVWQNILADRKVDCLVLSNFQFKRESDVAAQLWTDETHWSQKYADGKTLIFAWSGPDKTFAGSLSAELNRQAFGNVPDNQRSPAKASPWPQEEPSLWSTYWEGVRPYPLAAQEATLWLQYFERMGSSWQNVFNIVAQVARGADAAGLGAYSITVPYTLGTMGVIPNRIYPRQYRSNGNFLLRARDYGPPGAPILMMRCVRRALAENPEDPRVFLLLSDAIKAILNHQEDYWTNYQGDPRLLKGMRLTMRQIQVITALMTYLDLKPNSPQIHEQVGTMFLHLNFLDAALEQFQEAARNFDQYRPIRDDPQTLEVFKNKKKALDKTVQSLDEEVNKRRDQYVLAAANKQGFDKYRVAMADDRGLAQEGVSLLQNMKVEALTPQESAARDFELTRLLLMMGRANYITEGLAKIGPALPEFRAFHAAALGNYADLDKVLADMIRSRIATRAQALSATVVLNGLDQTGIDQLPLIARVLSVHLGLTRLARTTEDLARPEAELRALRGIMNLEFGDTRAARLNLQSAMQVAGPESYFQDRPIAERYLQLLREADK